MPPLVSKKILDLEKTLKRELLLVLRYMNFTFTKMADNFILSQTLTLSLQQVISLTPLSSSLELPHYTDPKVLVIQLQCVYHRHEQIKQ